MMTNPEDDYARGYVPFLDCTIYLDSHPLIPRTETEYWVEKVIHEIQGRGAGAAPRVLDLFAGSGAIGVAVLKHIPDSHVDFGEIDVAHFETIHKNIRENGIDPSRVHVIETDVWSKINSMYDFILANPPYIAPAQRERIQDSVLLHEPERALFADEDGFALIRKTIEGVKQHLEAHGVLYIEHEPEHVNSITACARESGFDATVSEDQYGIKRFSSLTRRG